MQGAASGALTFDFYLGTDYGNGDTWTFITSISFSAGIPTNTYNVFDYNIGVPSEIAAGTYSIILYYTYAGYYSEDWQLTTIPLGTATICAPGPQCASCSASSTCTSCLSGYEYIGGACYQTGLGGGADCSYGSQCTSGVCGEGNCCGSAYASSCYNCATTSPGVCWDCNSGYVLESGACYSSNLGIGAACTYSAQCVSGNCAGDVCVSATPTSTPASPTGTSTPASGTNKWFLGAVGETCTAVCGAQSLACSGTGWPMSVSDMSAIAADTGVTCGDIEEGSATYAADPEDTSGTCYYGGGAGTCPSGADGARFCPCILPSVTPSGTPTSSLSRGASPSKSTTHTPSTTPTTTRTPANTHSITSTRSRTPSPTRSHSPSHAATHTATGTKKHKVLR